MPYDLRLTIKSMLMNEYITYNDVASYLESKGFSKQIQVCKDMLQNLKMRRS